MDSAHSVAPRTLAVDIGGSHIKAGVLDAAGGFLSGPGRLGTPSPATPQAVLATLDKLVGELEPFDRISVGFPGVVRRGVVLTAPNLDTATWAEFPLASRLRERFAKPARLLNDAEVQGLGVIEGRGLECVITLGTGMGFGLFLDGRVAPHLELSHHPVHKRKTYEEFIGARALREVGPRRWNRRMRRVINCLESLVNYDVLYIGGGNAKRLALDLPSNVRTVSNQAGITGGVRLWDPAMESAFA
ncbi:MAG: ROK family protein [Acetobacteraceae bacterium]